MTQIIQQRWTLNEMEQTFGELLKLDLKSYDVALYFGSLLYEEGLYVYAEVPLGKNLGDEIRSVVNNNLAPKKRSRKNTDFVIRAYDPEVIPEPQEIVWELADDAADVMEYLAPLAGKSNIPDYAPEDKLFAKGLRCFVVILQKPGYAPLYCFRRYTSRKILKTGGQNLFAFMNQGKYTKLESPTLQIDTDIDCIYWDGKIFIFNQQEYHEIFREGPHIKRAAQEALALLGAQNIMDEEQFDAFSKACMHDLRKRARLHNIALKGRISAEHLRDLDKLEIFLAEYPVKVRIVTIEGVKQLRYDKKGIWDMLKLLDDAYVISQLSGKRYVTNSRQQL